MAIELSKAEFKEKYKKYRTKDDGWTDDYWDHFFERREDMRFYFEEPKTPAHTRMFVNQHGNSVHLYFMTLDAEESLFDYPGKE